MADAAGGPLGLLFVGLAITMPLILFGSALRSSRQRRRSRERSSSWSPGRSCRSGRKSSPRGAGSKAAKRHRPERPSVFVRRHEHDRHSRADRQSDDVEWATNQAIALNRQKPVLAHLLSVRHALPMHITQFFGRGDLRSFYQEAGLQVLAPAMQSLDQAGVRYEPHVLVGRPAQSIVKLAKQLGDVPIILPQRREGLL